MKRAMILKAYVDQRPAVRIELREDTSDRILEAVKDGTADIGIFSDHIGQTELEQRIYRRDTLMVIVPRGHPLEGEENLTIRDIAAYDHVGLQVGSSLQARVTEAAREAGLDINLRVHVYGFDGIRRMVEAGLGIAVLPQGAVLPYLNSRSITAMTLDEPWADRTLYVGYREYRGLPLVARHLVEMLAPLARKRPDSGFPPWPSQPTRPPSPINGGLGHGLRRSYQSKIDRRKL